MTSVMLRSGSMLVCDSPSGCNKWFHNNNVRFAKDCFQRTKAVVLTVVASLPLTQNSHTHTPQSVGWGCLYSMNSAEGAGGSVSHVNKLGWGNIWFPWSLFPPSLPSVLSNLIQAILESVPPLSDSFKPAFSDLLGPHDNTGPRVVILCDLCACVISVPVWSLCLCDLRGWLQCQAFYVTLPPTSSLSSR